MNKNIKIIWCHRLDWICVWAGALIPIGLVIGNIAFEFLVSLVCLSWVIRLSFGQDNTVKNIIRHPLTLPLILCFGCIILSLLWNGPGKKGWMHDVVFIRYVLYILALIDTSRRMPVGRYMCYGLIAGVLYSAVNMGMAYLFGFDLVGKSILRYTGKLKEASRISGLMAYATPFFAGWVVRDRIDFDRQRIVLVCLCLLSFFLLFQTQVRTSLIAALAGTLFSLGFGVLKRVPLGFAIIIGSSVITAFTFLFYITKLYCLDSLYDRIYYWKVVWRMCIENPIFGVGISSFQESYQRVAASGSITPFAAPNGVVYQLGEVMHAHNIILVVTSCTGILGLAAFCWLFVIAVRLIYNNQQGWSFGLVPWPVTFFVIGLTGFNIFGSWYLTLFSFFMAMIGSRVYFKVVTSGDTQAIEHQT